MGGVDLLLINAPVHDYGDYPRFHATHSPPLGLLSIATSVAAAGFKVQVYDAELYQASPGQIEDEVRRLEPRWVGVNSFSVNVRIVRKIVERIRSQGTPLILGGPHITNMPDAELISQFGGFPVYVRGDGESPVVRLLEGVAPSQICGAFGGGIMPGRASSGVALSSLTDLPMIDRRFSHGEPFDRLNRRWYGLTLTRGCVFRCAFCAGSSHSSGMPYRANSATRVFDEIDYLVGLGASGIRIFDDLPFKGKRPLIAFLGEALERYAHALAWELSFPLQYCQTLTPAEWQFLSDAHLLTITTGVEAADADMRADLGKRVNDSRLREIVATALEYGIGLRLYFIIGSPGESAASVDRTVALARELAFLPARSGTEGVRCSIFAYKPMPGSKLWEQLIAEGYTASQLLDYTDFELAVPEFQKHAWRSSLKLSELGPGELSERIDRFYFETQTVNSESTGGRYGFPGAQVDDPRGKGP
jgi:anaerobic magnesium-protoporphyrin IX monomethyl ester cyclase